MIEICGTIEDVRFRNDENGYSIVTIDHNGEPVIVVGSFPPIAEGDKITALGEFVVHPKFGRQFKADHVKNSDPDTLEGIVRYLSSGAIRGVGEKTARKIVDEFGHDTFNVLEFHPERLAQVSKISQKKAADICSQFKLGRAERDAMVFFASYGLPLSIAVKSYALYGKDTVSVVKSNPYILIEDIDGVGFLTADRIAKAVGIEKDSLFRRRAGIIHVLKEASEHDGNTYLPREDLTAAAAQVLECSQSAIPDALDSLLLDRKAVMLENGGVMLDFVYRAEKSAAAKLYKIINSAEKIITNCHEHIGIFEQLNGITLHEMQKEAVVKAVTEGVSVVTGGPGTGKTTILKCVLFIFGRLNFTFKIMAPTGRAAKRIQESTGYDASTIHRALGEIDFCEDGLDAEVVVVDEFSMVDIFLFNSLLRSIPQRARLLIVGDKDQLPSVGAGNVLKDIMESALVSVTHLSYIYRQASESMIIYNAHKINNGQMPVLNQKDKDFYFFKTRSAGAAADMVVDLVKNRIPRFTGIDSLKIQTLCPVKNGDAGTINLNKRLQDALNPDHPPGSAVVGDNVFYVGDRVMNTVNNYQLQWTKGSLCGEGVFNGDLGTVTSITPAGEIEVEFEDMRRVLFTDQTRKQLILSYAMTVHKSQGSEFEVAVIPICAANPVLMTRNLLYTAITRAKQMAVLVGEEYYIKRMIDNNYIADRHSALKYFICKADADTKKLFDLG